jgi:nucleotide-binding universal stress UspA family protein
MAAILACVDGSEYSRNVATLAGWAAQRMGARVALLQVHGRRVARRRARPDPALEAVEDERARLLRKQAMLDLEEARVRVEAQNVFEVTEALRDGDLLDIIAEMEPDHALTVIGKRGLAADYARGHLGSNLERVIRSAAKPVIVASRTHGIVRRVMIADDGGAAAQTAVRWVVESPLFRGLHCDLVAVGPEAPDARRRLEETTTRLRAAGTPANPVLLHGQPDAAIADYVATQPVDMLLMGAYSHSRLRSFVIGSTTSELIRSCHIPMTLFP